MDCEPPFTYADYTELFACRAAMSQTAQETLRAQCEGADDVIILDEVVLSGVTYSIMRRCSDLRGTSDPEINEMEASK